MIQSARVVSLGDMVPLPIGRVARSGVSIRILAQVPALYTCTCGGGWSFG